MVVEIMKKEFDLFIQSSSRAAAIINRTGEILYSNPSFDQFIKSSTDEKNIYSLLSFDQSDMIELNETSNTSFVVDAYLDPYIKIPTLFMRMNDREDFLIVFPQNIGINQVLPQKYANQIFNDLNLGLVVVSLDARIKIISHLACEILGIKKEDVVGKTFKEVFPEVAEEDLLITKHLFEGVTERNKPITWSTNGKRYDLLLDSHLLFNDDGEVDGAYIIFKDVTNLRSIDEKIQRSDRLAMIGQIAAGTAHEIRNPLTSIRGFLQILRSSLNANGLVKEKGYVELMLTEIKRINSLVDQFLLLSKPRDVQYQPINLNDVLQEIIPIVQNEAVLYEVEIIDKTNNELPIIIGDSELLKQVFLNVCKNGMEAIGSNGKVTITYDIDKLEKRVIINIHDTGPGIPSYIVDRLFDPFFTTKDEGTGLGLSVCQRIIKDIGGHIRVSSKGFGTVFHIAIPYLMF